MRSPTVTTSIGFFPVLYEDGSARTFSFERRAALIIFATRLVPTSVEATYAPSLGGHIRLGA